MTVKGQRHDRRGARRRHLLVAAAVLLVAGLGCEGGGEAPLSPLVPEVSRIAAISASDIEVRIRANAEWGPWTVVVDSMAASVPMSETLVFQFRQDTQYSSLAGFQYPELDTCYLMPAHSAGSSSWRVSYGADPGPYPAVGRIEFRPDETHVTQAESRILWFMAERWDNAAAAYVAASPWFMVRFTPDETDYQFHQE